MPQHIFVLALAISITLYSKHPISPHFSSLSLCLLSLVLSSLPLNPVHVLLKLYPFSHSLYFSLQYFYASGFTSTHSQLGTSQPIPRSMLLSSFTRPSQLVSFLSSSFSFTVLSFLSQLFILPFDIRVELLMTHLRLFRPPPPSPSLLSLSLYPTFSQSAASCSTCSVSS